MSNLMWCLLLCLYLFFFFKQKTAYEMRISDWSSDVCSPDLHQMPAYHLIAPDGGGITLVNIGVGPSNAKTICDHLAVLRPEAWLMIGHCGGLRPSQRIGDYVLAHAYLRDDHILDAVQIGRAHV